MLGVTAVVMSNEQIEQQFQLIRRQIAALRGEDVAGWGVVDAALEDLHVTCEQMQTNLDSIEIAQEELLQQKQYYQDLFQFFPIASLITDANGVILEANQAIAQLLNVSPSYLVGKPLVMFVAGGDYPLGDLRNNRTIFRTHLNQLSQSTGTQIWRMSLCPRDREPILVELQIAIARNTDGRIEHLRIGVYHLSQSQEPLTFGVVNPTVASVPPQHLDGTQTGMPTPQLPQSFDGLRVLVVDDEADIREFMMAVLEGHGISVKAVANARAALEALEPFQPDVLVCDLRMPGESGYDLIRQIRDLEAKQGGYLPATAITAYQDEDWQESRKAGFEAHLHKFAQPSEWVEIIARLANLRSTSPN